MGYIIAGLIGAALALVVMKFIQHRRLKPKTFTPDKMDEIERKLMAGEL